MLWFGRRRKQRQCFHHNRINGESWIKHQLINMGMGKMFWCKVCQQTWFA